MEVKTRGDWSRSTELSAAFRFVPRFPWPTVGTSRKAAGSSGYDWRGWAFLWVAHSEWPTGSTCSSENRAQNTNTRKYRSFMRSYDKYMFTTCGDDCEKHLHWDRITNWPQRICSIHFLHIQRSDLLTIAMHLFTDKLQSDGEEKPK